MTNYGDKLQRLSQTHGGKYSMYSLAIKWRATEGQEAWLKYWASVVSDGRDQISFKP